MKNTKEQISSLILIFTVACFIECSSLLYTGIAGITNQDTWIAVITGFIFSLPIVWIFSALCEKFPGKTLIEINDIIFGKILGKIISSLYIFFFFTLCIINSSQTGDFVIDIILPETPKAVVLIMFIIVCVYAVRKGFEIMTRYSMLIFNIALIALLAAILLLLNKSKLSNLQPMLSLPFINYVQSTHQISELSFSNIFVFTMIFPSLKNPQKIKKPMFLGLIIGALFMLGVVLIDIVALGPAEALVAFPSFDVIRLIEVSDVITRMDFAYEFPFLILFFFKVSILLYVTVKAIAQLFNIKSYKLLAPVVGALVVLFSLSSYDSYIESTYISANILPFYQAFFQLILPLITLIIAAMRGFRKPAEVSI